MRCFPSHQLGHHHHHTFWREHQRGLWNGFLVGTHLLTLKNLSGLFSVTGHAERQAQKFALDKFQAQATCAESTSCYNEEDGALAGATLEAPELSIRRAWLVMTAMMALGERYKRLSHSSTLPVDHLQKQAAILGGVKCGQVARHEPREICFCAKDASLRRVLLALCSSISRAAVSGRGFWRQFC